jgi:L-aspartate oxidase
MTRDVVIAGAGLAGLFLALKLAPRPVTVLSPAQLGEASASAWAQGGLAAALTADDSPALHAADTIAAGAGLVDPAIAALVAEDGPARVRDLLELGVPFDRSADGALSLSLEAAHSRPRVARVSGDLAGKAIMDALIAAARARTHIEILEGTAAVALALDGEGGVCGVVCRDASGREQPLAARETVLATGGVGGLWAVTTNPKEARGAGLGMAFAAGALVADVEFVQFHPTAIAIDRDPAPLATEALRGEGARLVNEDGAPFMTRYDPAGELAARDIVARAIHREREAGRGAYLDARSAIGAHFPERFPTVFAACMAAGLDPRTQPIPVAPAAHYHMGGVVSDAWGRATLAGLSVVGECASTGAHGANRLASNSLLESVVFSNRIAERLREDALRAAGAPRPHAVAPALPEAARAPLRALMQRDVGVDRDKAGLARACETIAAAQRAHGPAHDLIAMSLIARAALARCERRGGHYRSDCPAPLPPARTFLSVNDDDPFPA